MRDISDKILSGTGRYTSRLVWDGGELSGEEIRDWTVTSSITGSSDRLTLGATPAAQLTASVVTDAKLLDRRVRLYIGRGGEEISVGVFMVTDAPAVDGVVTLTGYDAMYTAMERGYYPTVSGATTARAVLADAAQAAGLALVLPDGLDAPVSGVSGGYTLREVVGYMAALLGCNARIDGDGALRVQWFRNSGLTLDGDSIYSGGAALNSEDWTLGKLTCSVTTTTTTTDEDGVTSRTDSTETLTSGNGATGVSFSNPWMTQSLLDGIFNRIGMTYRSGEVSALGDLRVEVGDVVSAMGETFPAMAQMLGYDGGLRMTLSAYAESESDGGGEGVSGPMTTAMERYAVELAQIRELDAQRAKITRAHIARLNADKASVDDLTAVKADIETLTADKLDAATHGLINVPGQIVPHQLLEGHHAGVDEQAAQLVRLFVQGDGVAALHQRLRRHHTGGAAADDHDALALGFRQPLDLPGDAAAGVDGAAHGRAIGVGVAAQVAAGAGAHSGALAGERLMDDVAVGHEALRHGDDVRLAGGDDVLGLLQRGDHADHRHGDVQVLLHLGGVVHVQRLVGGAEVGGDGVAGGEVENGALGDVHDVHILLRQLHERQRLFKFQTAGDALSGGDPQLDDHVVAHGLADGLQHLEGVLTAVFRTAAVLVGADVGVGGQPLGEEVVVGAVEQDHAETGVLTAHGAVHEVLLHLVHVGAGHGAHIVIGVQGALGGDDGGGLTVGGGAVAAAGIGQLHGELRTVLAAFLHQRVHAVDAVVVAHVHLAQPVGGVVVGDWGVAHGDPGHASLCLPVHEVQHILAHRAVRVAFQYNGGGILQTVFQREPPDGKGMKYMRSGWSAGRSR